jgi:hypothetical protein
MVPVDMKSGTSLSLTHYQMVSSEITVSINAGTIDKVEIKETYEGEFFNSKRVSDMVLED